MSSTISVEAVSPLRRGMIEDMCVRKFGEKTQHDYIRHVEQFAKFLGRSPDTATGKDLRRPHSSLDGTTPDHAYFTPLPLRMAAQPRQTLNLSTRKGCSDNRGHLRDLGR
jgi:hypothetical protein